MKINVLEKIMHGRDVFEAGETRVVTDEIGTYFCSMGWAEDVDGKVETGTRDIHRSHVLDVQSAKATTIVEDI